MAAYTRTTVIDSAPAGDTVKEAVLDLDTDLTGIVAAYNAHDTATTNVHGFTGAKTGSGAMVGATSPTLVTPVLGVATVTSINKVAITAPATSATLVIADGKTLTISNSLTLTATDGSTLAIGTGGTLGTAAYTAATAYEASGAIATHAALITGVHGLVFTAGKTLTLTESLTFNAGGAGALRVATAANTVGNLAVGATTEILVGGGAGVVPVWTTATGTGAPVRATSPTLVTPLLGTPTSGVLSGCSGYPGLAITAGKTITVTQDTSLDEAVAMSSKLTIPGAWTTGAFNAADFTGKGSMTWTVDAGDIITFAYKIMGKVMVFAFSISSFSIGGTPNNVLYIAIPGGITVTKAMNNPCRINDNGTKSIGWVSVIAGGNVLQILKTDESNFTASTNASEVYGEITFEIN